MKKQLLFGLFALAFSVNVSAEDLTLFMGGTPVDITDSSATLEAGIMTATSSTSVLMLGYTTAIGGDTLWSDTVPGTASTTLSSFQFPIDGLLGGTLYNYSVKAWEVSDPSAANAVWGSIYTFTTLAPPYAEVHDVTHSGVTQDSATLSAEIIIGSSGSAEVRLQMFDGVEGVLLQQSLWILVYQNSTVSHLFSSLGPGANYGYRALVRDIPNIDTSDWGWFSTPPVPLPSVTIDSLHMLNDGCFAYVSVNPGGSWSGSQTTTSFIWWTTGTADSVTVSGITSAEQVIFPPISGIALGTTVHYKVSATNDAGTVYTPEQSYVQDTTTGIREVFTNLEGVMVTARDVLGRTIMAGEYRSVFMALPGGTYFLFYEDGALARKLVK